VWLTGRKVSLRVFAARRNQRAPRSLDYEDETVEILVKSGGAGTADALVESMHATFFQKVILCAIAAFFAAALIQWGRVFVEGADDALNKGYQHRAVIGPSNP